MPLVRYHEGQHEAAVELLRKTTINGDYSIIAALLHAVCNHHLGNWGVAMAFYRDIYDKANDRVFFNRDSTEFIKAFIEKHAFEEPQAREFNHQKVNYFLRRSFQI